MESRDVERAIRRSCVSGRSGWSPRCGRSTPRTGPRSAVADKLALALPRRCAIGSAIGRLATTPRKRSRCSPTPWRSCKPGPPGSRRPGGAYGNRRRTCPLVIIIDEYAELADEAPDAMSGADSIARLGRAVAVTLVAATQRTDPESHEARRGPLPDGGQEPFARSACRGPSGINGIERPALQRFEKRFIERLLSGSELIPNQINPVLVPIEGSTSEESRL